MMDLKKLINQKVTHTTLGNGYILNITNSNVTVKFARGGVQFFSFPNTFKNNIIRFIDIDHDEVLKEILKEEETVEEIITTTEPEKIVVVSEPEEIVIEKEEPEVIKVIEEEIKAEEVIEPKDDEINILEILDNVIFDKSYQEVAKETTDDYELFLKEFNEYWEEKRLLSYIIIKYVNKKKIYKNLKDEVLKIIKKTIKDEPTQLEKGFVTVFIAMIAHKEYDGTIWPYIEQELEELYLKEDQVEINRAIRKLIHDNEYGGEVSVLIHAGLFIKYYKDYFTFMYDIYKANFNQNILNAPVEQILTDTFTGIKEELKKDDSDMLYVKLTNSTYYLNKFTKQAMIIAPQEMAKLYKSFLRHIDLWYHENKYYKHEARLHLALKMWLENEASKISKIIINKKPHIVKPRFKFYPEVMEMKLKLPHVNLVGISNLDLRKLSVEFIEDKKKISLELDINYRIYQRIGYYSIIISKYLVKNPLASLKLNVYYDKKLIYTSSENITQDIYVFDEQGLELAQTKDYLGYIYIVHELKQKFLNAKEYPLGTHKVSYFKIDEANQLKLKERREIEETELSLGLNGHEVLNLNGRVNKENYPLYSSIKSFVFESVYKAKDMVLIINKQIRSLKEVISSDNETSHLFKFEIDLKKLNLVSDIYDIEIKDLKGNYVAAVSFIYDKDLNITIREKDKTLLYDFVLNSAFPITSKQRLNYDLTVENEVRYAFKLNNKIVEYIVPLNLPRFKYNLKDKWQTLDDIEYIGSELYVTSDVLSIDVLLKTEIMPLKQKINNPGYKIYDLNSLKAIKIAYGEFVQVVFNLEGSLTRKHNLYLKPTVVNKPALNFINENSLNLTFDFKCYTEGRYALEVTDPMKALKTFDLVNKQATIEDFVPFKEYNLAIKEKVNGVNGIKLEDFYEDQIVIIDTHKLEDKTFMLDKVNYLNKKNKEEMGSLKNLAIMFGKRITDRQTLALTSLNYSGVNYECELYSVGRNNSLKSFNFKETFYCEILSDRSSSDLVIKIEDENGNLLSADPSKKSIKNKSKKNDFSIVALYFDVLKGNKK